LQDPPKFTQNWEFWFENKPSGNPVPYYIWDIFAHVNSCRFHALAARVSMVIATASGSKDRALHAKLSALIHF
jgi:hypothetical protein